MFMHLFRHIYARYSSCLFLRSDSPLPDCVTRLLSAVTVALEHLEGNTRHSERLDPVDPCPFTTGRTGIRGFRGQ